MQQKQPPKVVVPLESVQANEGSPVLLQATVVGKPTPTVRYGYSVEISLSLISCLVYLVQRWCTDASCKSPSYTIRY
jgi:hypothetical protein